MKGLSRHRDRSSATIYYVLGQAPQGCLQREALKQSSASTLQLYSPIARKAGDSPDQVCLLSGVVGVRDAPVAPELPPSRSSDLPASGGSVAAPAVVAAALEQPTAGSLHRCAPGRRRYVCRVMTVGELVIQRGLGV